MQRAIDISGQRFERLVAVEQVGSGRKEAYWRCKCDCGSETVTRGSKLRAGLTSSCGCVSAEKLSQANRKHGLHSHPIASIWYGIKARCLSPSNPAYKNYGGRGIQVCDRWLDLKNFIDDMYPAFQLGMTLDRINNDGNYEPSNCRWATRKQQARNRRSTLYVQSPAGPVPLAEWAEVNGLNYGSAWWAINERRRHS
jgi:hypothetical protein